MGPRRGPGDVGRGRRDQESKLGRCLEALGTGLISLDWLGLRAMYGGMGFAWATGDGPR